MSDFEVEDIQRTAMTRFTDEPEVQSYLRLRLPGCSIGEISRTFELGYIPPNWCVWKPFGGRITIPYYSPDFELLGFRGIRCRLNDTRPKSLPYPTQTQQFSIPLGLNPNTLQAFRDTRFCVVVEGEMDMLTCWAVGIPAVASCMSVMTDTGAQSLSRVVDCAIVWADNDASPDKGLHGAMRTCERLESVGVKVHLTLCRAQGIKDANDYLTHFGVGAVRDFISKAVEDAASMNDEGTKDAE